MILELPEYGNCSRWCSAMLMKCHLVTGFYVWPKTVFINMFENYKKTHIKSLENMNIVYYEQPEHVDILAYGVKGKLGLGSSIAPFQFVRNFFYRDLRQFSNCIVRVTP